MADVAVLGCGPAGLLTALAVEQHGHMPQIYSLRKPSPMGGAQYLHDPIPDVTAAEPDGYIRYVKFGTAQGYAKKVYGDYQARTSWDKFPDETYPAWSLRRVYEQLWRRYADWVHPQHVDADLANAIAREYTMTFSTIPAPALCCDPRHRFEKQIIYIGHSAPDWIANNTVVYHGHRSAYWYRASRIFGERSIEHSAASHVALGDVEGFKPVSHDCDCLPHIRRLGRFGQWKRGVLTHHAYQQANRMLEELHAVQ